MARAFNGSSDVITTASNTGVNFLRTDTFSLCGWFNFAGNANAEMCIFGRLNAASGFIGWELHKESSGGGNVINFFLINSFSSNCIDVDSDFAPSLSTWYHLAVTYSGSSTAAGVKIYANGALRTPTVLFDSLSGSTQNALPIKFGTRSDGTKPFQGSMADCAAYSATLTAGEISALAQGMRPNRVRPSALAGYWPFDGLSSPEPELSGNVNNGTLAGTSSGGGPPTTLWTPKRPSSAIIPAGGVSFIPAWIMGSNLPVIGAGTY